MKRITNDTRNCITLWVSRAGRFYKLFANLTRRHNFKNAKRKRKEKTPADNGSMPLPSNFTTNLLIPPRRAALPRMPRPRRQRQRHPGTAGTRRPDRSCSTPLQWIPCWHLSVLDRKKIIIRPRYSHLIHTLASIPMQESLAPKHDSELIADTLEQLLDWGRVSDESRAHL